MFLILVTHDKTKSVEIVKWEGAVEELPEKARDKIREFNTCFAVAMLQYMVFGSFFLYVVLRPFMFLIKPFHVVERPQVVSSVERLESDALAQDALRVARDPMVAV